MKNDEDLRRLLAAYRPPDAPDAERRTLQILRTLPRRRPVGTGRFLLAQAGFIRKGMWALQLAFLLGTVLLAQKNLRPTAPPLDAAWRISAAMPLLILINITDLSRIYNGGMLEIELATRFSLSGVAAARLLIFGLSDGVILLLCAALTAPAARVSLLLMLAYCLVPFDLMCLGCLLLLRRVKQGSFTACAAVLAATLAALSMWGRTWPYERISPKIWALAALLLTAALGWQAGVFLRALRPGRRLPAGL